MDALDARPTRLPRTGPSAAGPKIAAPAGDGPSDLPEYRAVLDRHAIVATTDAAGRITYVSDAFCAISGYPRAELIGRDHSFLKSGVQSDAFYREMWATLAEGRSWRGDICNRARSGRLYWVDTEIVPIRREQAIAGYVAFQHDITARKADEAALSASRQRLQSVIEGTRVATWEWNVETGETLFNDRWAEIVGLQLADLEPTTFETWADLVHPDDLRRSLELQERHLAGELPFYECEIRMRHRDGRWIWVHDRGRVSSRAADGRPLLMAGTHQDISKRRAVEEELLQSREQLRAVIENFPGGITFVDGDLQMLGCNDRYREMLELPDEMFEGGMPSLVDIFRFNAMRGEFGPGDVEEFVEERVRRAMIPEPHVFERTRPNGVTLEIRGMPMPGGGWVTSYIDVTDRIAAQEALIQKSRLVAETSRELQITLAHMNQGLSVYDPDGRIVLWNMQFVHLFGMRMDELVEGMSLVELLLIQRERGDFDGDPEAFVENLAAEMATGVQWEHVATTASGRVVKSVHSPRPDGGWIATHEDITERERAAAQVVHAAHHDMLTGLRNRVGFKLDLEKALAAAGRGARFSILLVDLDRFKAVNDTFGHAMGDRLLHEVADRMRACTRGRDVVARLGGDEFAILCAPTPDPIDGAIVVATRMLASLAEPYRLDGHELLIGASIGIAIAPQDGETADQLLGNADSALYEVKANGRNGFRLFDERIAEAAREKRVLEGDLREALARDELELHFQPIVDAVTRRIRCMEALLRWRHPRRGYVEPDVFIPIAEQTGLIRPIGQWVIRNAIAAAARWPADVSVAINVSPVQLGQRELVDVVARELVRSRLDPSRLEIEVTESVLMGQDEAVLGDLHQLKTLDVRIALDDFGTGYSSMSYLRLFPFDRIKIDRSFVDDIAASRHCAAIVCAVTSLARSLDIDTTAEGVETEAQMLLLTAAGCSCAQGYLFGRPRPLAEIDFDGDGRLAGGRGA